MAKMVTIPRPAPDRVMFVVCDEDGAVAHVMVHQSVVEGSDLEQFLAILRDGQAKARQMRMMTT